MRRVKSRADKSSIDVGPVSAPPPPASVQPIVETMDTAADDHLTDMITQQEGEEVAVDIIADVMDNVMDRCCQVYLKRQLIPFSVWWARNNLVQTLECLFLMRDEGDDPEREPFWKEDPEPQPGAIDSWAEGCVPVVHAAQI